MEQPKEITDLQEAILALHGCRSLYSRTVRVQELVRGDIVWDELVMIFTLIGHPKAKHCFAWRYREGGETKTITVLEIPPVDSPGAAVKVTIAAKTREE